jgi:hypothetical protein
VECSDRGAQNDQKSLSEGIKPKKNRCSGRAPVSGV